MLSSEGIPKRSMREERRVPSTAPIIHHLAAQFSVDQLIEVIITAVPIIHMNIIGLPSGHIHGYNKITHENCPAALASTPLLQ